MPSRLLSRVVSYDVPGSTAAVPPGALLVVPFAAAAGERPVALAGGLLFAGSPFSRRGPSARWNTLADDPVHRHAEQPGAPS